MITKKRWKNQCTNKRKKRKSERGDSYAHGANVPGHDRPTSNWWESWADGPAQQWGAYGYVRPPADRPSASPRSPTRQ